MYRIHITLDLPPTPDSDQEVSDHLLVLRDLLPAGAKITAYYIDPKDAGSDADQSAAVWALQQRDLDPSTPV